MKKKPLFFTILITDQYQSNASPCNVKIILLELATDDMLARDTRCEIVEVVDGLDSIRSVARLPKDVLYNLKESLDLESCVIVGTNS